MDFKIWRRDVKHLLYPCKTCRLVVFIKYSFIVGHFPDTICHDMKYGLSRVATVTFLPNYIVPAFYQAITILDFICSIHMYKENMLLLVEVCRNNCKIYSFSMSWNKYEIVRVRQNRCYNQGFMCSYSVCTLTCLT